MNTNDKDFNKKVRDLFWSCSNCGYRKSLRYASWGCFDGDCPAQGFSFHDPIKSRSQVQADLAVVDACTNKNSCTLSADDLNVCHYADICKNGDYKY